MSGGDSQFLYRLRERLRGTGAKAPDDRRHPFRNGAGYDAIKWQAASQIDALCERIVREIENGIADIDDVIAPIAAPLAEQLAKGAISDVFEAAAEVLKAQIRQGSGKPSE
ncbi:MAG: hypothetical protein WB783_20480 [Arenicellales bacterium]